MPTGNGNVTAQTATSTFNSFSQFNVVGESMVLPVVLSDFTASTKKDRTVLLSWYTSGEMNLMDFELQRSTDGSAWENIGTVDAKNNISTTESYSFVDVKPAAGINYYRLIMRSTNGLSNNSPARMVKIAPSATISMFPNPANNFVHVSLNDSDSEANITLITPLGQVMASSTVGNGAHSTTTFNITNYPAGVYFVRLESGENIFTSMLVIAH